MTADGPDVHVGAARETRLEQLTREILTMCGRATGLESTYLTLIHRESDEQEILYSRNVGSIEIPEGLRVQWSDTICRRALEGDGPTSTQEVPTVYGDVEAASALGLQTYISVPVRQGDTAIGTLCGASANRVTVSADAERLMTSLAEMLAMQLALEDSSGELEAEVAELDRVANTDALTGLANRRRLDQAIRGYRSLDGDALLSVLALDLDRFKSINDTHGHQVGDEALQHVAHQLLAVCRPTDTVVRMGGDEFIVLLPDTDATEAGRVGERLRAALVADDALTSAGGVPVRVSVGVATGPLPDIDALLRAADAALYEAKTHRP